MVQLGRARYVSRCRRSSCVNACTWTTTIPGTDRGNTVEYTLHAVDNNGNWNNTTAVSYDIGEPTKVFVIEWHDMTAGFNSGYNVNYQVRLYDVTNEIEFEYDTAAATRTTITSTSASRTRQPTLVSYYAGAEMDSLVDKIRSPTTTESRQMAVRMDTRLTLLA